MTRGFVARNSNSHKIKGLISVSVISLCFLVNLIGCVGPAPRRDMEYANVALEAAREANALKYAPGLFRQAEDLYRQGLAQYEERQYEEARELFLRAKQYAEKSENYTLLKKAEGGVSE